MPGLYLWGFFTPPVAGADFLAALVASCFLGALPPVDLRAVCLVLAMLVYLFVENVDGRTSGQRQGFELNDSRSGTSRTIVNYPATK